MSMKSKNKTYQRISPEIRRSILSASPNESNGELARKHGISGGSVWLIRKKAGIKSKAKPTGGKAQQTEWVPEPDTALPESLPITMTVTERTLDAWWRGLPIQQKGAIFSGNYVIRVEGTIQ